MTNEKIKILLDKCLYIQRKGHGNDGFPYVDFETSNYGSELIIRLIANGFIAKGGYDYVYEAKLNDDAMSTHDYMDCIEYLDKLIARVNELEAYRSKKEMTVEEVALKLGHEIRLVVDMETVSKLKLSDNITIVTEREQPRWCF